MAINAFLSFGDVARGESAQKGHERWIEVEGWSWRIEAESSWTKGGGAAVGKPQPGALSWTHAFDASSIFLLGFISTGQHFPTAQLEVMRTGGGGGGGAKPFFRAAFEDVLLTEVATSGGSDGSILQSVAMVFRKIRIDYSASDPKGGLLGVSTYSWDIPAGTASPSSLTAATGGAAPAAPGAAVDPAAQIDAVATPLDPATVVVDPLRPIRGAAISEGRVPRPPG